MSALHSASGPHMEMRPATDSFKLRQVPFRFRDQSHTRPRGLISTGRPISIATIGFPRVQGFLPQTPTSFDGTPRNRHVRMVEQNLDGRRPHLPSALSHMSLVLILRPRIHRADDNTSYPIAIQANRPETVQRIIINRESNFGISLMLQTVIRKKNTASATVPMPRHPTAIIRARGGSGSPGLSEFI